MWCRILVAMLLAGPLCAQAVPDLQEDQIISGERDGKWTLSVKLSREGAAGLQFEFEDFRLPAGAKLLLRKVDASGQAGEVVAEYENGGPLESGQFVSDAVPGTEAVLEVVFEDGEASNLPFRISRMRRLSREDLNEITPRAEFLPERPELEGASGTALFRGIEVSYRVVEGIAVMEGDIMLGRVEELIPATGKSKDNARQAMGITSTSYRWPGGVMPYVIDEAVPNQARITDAIAHWNNNLGNTVRLAPWTNEAYYVRFVRPSSAGTCSSYVGMIRVANQAINIGDYCGTGNVIHEIGHAFGLFHEHTREDRNSFVTIMFENINPSATGNFNQQIATSDDIGAYDYGSIMHYGATSFSINGQPAIVTIPPGIPIGQRSALSPGDIAGAKAMYNGVAPPPPPSPTTVSITLTSNPGGRQLVVDGATITAPMTYPWTVGSVHTISAPSSTAGNTRYLFSSWSNGGAQTQTITTPSSATTYTANFTKQHKVTGASNNTSLGTVSASPAPADAFYNEGNSVTVTATPASSGACLSSWTGITAPPASPLQVSVSQPYSITGNFGQGAVTASPTSFSFSASGGTGTIHVTASAGCSWTATDNRSWITRQSSSGTGSGVVKFTVNRNNSGSSRSGTITIGNVQVTIQQAR
ncbi:MAG: hypothetical protein FJW20_18620 [Acidimicrobiia bacterium]|nr:hypothetical protein [Acidimicrobiia bacterium]